jgi:cell division protein FtsW (lipid II flippase)
MSQHSPIQAVDRRWSVPESALSERHELLLLMLSAAFVIASAASLSLVTEGKVVWGHLYAPAAWLVLLAVSAVLLRRFLPGHDPLLLPVFGLLTGWGLVLIDRLAPNFLDRQTLWLGLASGALLVVAILPRSLRILRRYRYTWLLFGILLLAATLVYGVNPSGQGATLWLRVPFLGRVFFQPSELLKLLLVVFLASYLDERQHLLELGGGNGAAGIFAYLAPLAAMWGFCIVVLIWQQDLGAATLFFIVFLTLIFLATGDWRYIAGGFALLLLAGVLGYIAFDVVALRVDTWLNPWPEFDSRGFQIVQSLYAVATGGVIGQGIGQGFPTFVPVVHSDFAFAAIAEEWGLVGSLTVVACFALLAYRGLRIASTSRRQFRMYLAAGITVVFSVQAILIMGGVTKLLPLTGVTLAFVSYGGSSLLMSSVMIGLLLNLSAGNRWAGRKTVS